MKRILVVIAIISLTFKGLAQEDNFKNFVLGLKFAPSIDWMQPNTRDYKSDGVVMKYSYGLMGDIMIGGSGHYYITVGLQFKNAGGKLTYDNMIDYDNDDIFESANVSRKYSASYISIPVAFKLKTAQFDRFTFFGVFGIDNAIRTKAVANDEYKLTNATIKLEKININKDVHLFKESILLGAGLEYTISGNTKAFTGINFYNGFTDMLKGSNQLHDVEENAINRSVELVLGISF
ncbi:MAG: outer membrane beta-barrel protein [Bacteroidales bacterium]